MTQPKRPPRLDERWTGCSGEHLSNRELYSAAKWCEENVDNQRLFWRKVGYDFWFFEPKWATMFVLRWGK